MTVDVNHRNHFHKSNYNKTECTSERVKHLKPVFSCTSTEDESNGEAEETNSTSQIRFPYAFENIDVENRAEHSLEYSYLGAQPQGQQHREEKHSPYP